MNGVQFTSLRDVRRVQILEAAAEVIAERGYAGLSMRVLAQRLGSSAASLYNYFRTKEEIFLELYSARVDQLGKEADQVLLEAKSLEELLRRFAEGYLLFYGELGRQLNLWTLLSDAEAIAELPAELVMRLRMQVATIFLKIGTRMEALAHDEGLTLMEPHLAVSFLWMTLGGLAEGFTGVKAGAQPFTWEQMSTFAAQVLVRGLTQPLPQKPKRKKR